MDIEQQRNYWKDMTIEDAYRWGDPLSGCAKSNGKVLGNYLSLLNRLVPLIAGKIVVEIGCGAGKWTQYLALHAKEVVAVDIIDSKYRFVAKNVRFYPTSGYELSGIATDYADVIFSIDTLVRTDKVGLIKYMLEFKRVLKPDGKMCIHLPCEMQPLSRKFGFEKLSMEDIKELFGVCNIDMETINHGVIVWV